MPAHKQPRERYKQDHGCLDNSIRTRLLVAAQSYCLDVEHLKFDCSSGCESSFESCRPFVLELCSLACARRQHIKPPHTCGSSVVQWPGGCEGGTCGGAGGVQGGAGGGGDAPSRNLRMSFLRTWHWPLMSAAEWETMSTSLPVISSSSFTAVDRAHFTPALPAQYVHDCVCMMLSHDQPPRNAPELRPSPPDCQ